MYDSISRLKATQEGRQATDPELGEGGEVSLS